MSGILAFASFKNKYPNSFFEKVGDTLLTPVTTLCQRNSFVVLKNETTGARCIYTYTNNSKSNLRVAAEVVVSVVTLPLALVGIVFKGLSLVTSPQTRDIYTYWTTPLQPQFGNPNKVQNDYFWDQNRQIGLAKRARNLMDLLTFSAEKGCAPQLLHEFIHHPREYLVATNDAVIGNHVHLLPYLEECTCVNSGHFNRFKNQRRTDLETQLVSDAVENFPPVENFRLNYVGFGAGKLLQDFINVGKLIEAGYKDLNIILIDPKFKKEEEIDKESDQPTPNPTLEQFKFLLKVAEQKGIGLQIQVFENITEYRKAYPDEKAHCISAIDFDCYQKAFNDMTLCHQVLHNKGKFYLSYDVHDLCFSSTQCLGNIQHGRQDPRYISTLDDFQEDVRLLSQKLFQKEQRVARYAQLGTEFNFEEWTRLLPELAKCGCDKIEFMLMHPPERNYFGAPLGPNAQFTKENLEYYLKLFLPAKTNIEVQLIESIDDFKKHVEHSQAKFDMVTWWGHATGDEQDAKANIRWIREHAADSTIYYGVQIYKREANGEQALTFDGLWRWNADSGTKYLIPPKPKHRAVISGLMEEQP